MGLLPSTAESWQGLRIENPMVGSENSVFLHDLAEILPKLLPFRVYTKHKSGV